MQMLDINALIERMVRPAVVRWYGHVLRRKEDNILKEALNFEMEGEKRKNQRLRGKNRLKLFLKTLV